MRVGVFHPGTQHSWQTALAFQESGQLAWYATSVFYDPRRWPYRIERYLPERWAGKVQREFKRRYSPLLDLENVRQFGLEEWLETAARRLKREKLAMWFNIAGNKSFGRSTIGLIKRESVDVVWGYGSAALEVFRWAKERGITCVLDQTLGHPAAMNRVMLDEQEKHPEFFPEAYAPFDRDWLDRQNKEVALADLVVVGSEFCGNTMIENGCPPEKLRIVPYGYDETIFPESMPVRRPSRGRPIDFLFVGAITARKGVAYLLQAFNRIPERDAALTMLGGLSIPEATFAKYSGRVRHVRHVPRPEVVGQLSRADCFVFPSLFEGGGIVLYEAMGAGLGIVQSAACGDAVAGGKNGVRLEPISVERLTEEIASLIRNPDRLVEWRQASWRMREDHTWRVYRDRARSTVSNW